MAVMMYAGNKNSAKVYDEKIARLIKAGEPLPGFEKKDDINSRVNLGRGANCEKKQYNTADGPMRPLC